MTETIMKIKDKIIVSCQASMADALYNCMPEMIASVIHGGAEGLRLAGEKDVRSAKKLSDIPVIGITKPDPLPENWKEIVYITPTFEDAKKLAFAGADIIAIDGTSRPHPKETLSELINKIHNELNKAVMVDIATLEEAKNCASLGADIISTTLSGYTQETLEKNSDEPDFELLEQLVSSINKPIILEGRIWEPEQVKKAFKLGAYAVVIGSAITRPQLITKRFIENSR